MSRLVLTFFLLFSSLLSHAQVVLHVSPTGNDRQEGSRQRPLKTVEKAVALASRLADKQVKIVLRQGTYYLEKTVVVHAAGFLPKSLQIAAYQHEQVVVSAGRLLQLQWKPFRNGIYQATLPVGVSFEQLYINDIPQHMARYPNYDSTARVFHGTAADAIAPERVKHWQNPVGGYIHALHKGEWGGFHYRITGVDQAGKLQLDGGWQNNRPAGMHNTHRFVENVFEELDAPGEWFVDPAKRVLYYYPTKGVDLSMARVEVSNLKNSLELRGTAAKPLRNISLTGLHFKHNERSFMDTNEPLLRSDWTIYRGGAVVLDGTEACSVTDCQFTDLGGNAVMVSNYNRRDTVRGCMVAQIGANAVCLIGDPKAVRSPLFRYEESLTYAQLDKTPGPLTNNYPQECVISDNLLHNLGEIEKQATGVQIEMASAITVSHNSIYNTPRAGINIGDGCWGGHVLAYNDVFNTVLETGDHGAFNSWGRDRFWHPNRQYMDSLAAAHPELILLDSQKQTIIRNNRFRCDHGWDIDLDDGSSNYHIYDNLCLNGGLKLREGFYRIVENNILINNSFHPHVWFKNSGDVFARNIVGKKYAPIRIVDWAPKIDYNLFPDGAALAAAQKNGTDQHSLVGDAQFVNAPAGDYTVKAQSPAFQLGFHPIPMDQFGVQKPSLRKLAQQPAIPVVLTTATLADKSALIPFLGGTIKSVDGLGERSAYGLPDEAGVIVVVAGENSLLTKAGLQDKDVILTAAGKVVPHVNALLEMYQAENWTGRLSLTIIRNQQPMAIELLLK